MLQSLLFIMTFNCMRERLKNVLQMFLRLCGREDIKLLHAVLSQGFRDMCIYCIDVEIKVGFEIE